MQPPYSGSPVLYNFRTGESSVLSGGREPCSRIFSSPLLCDHNLREESLQPGRLQHLKEVQSEQLLLLLSTCTPTSMSLAQLRKLAILAQCPQQPMLPVIAILARSNRPLCLHLSPSSRACQHHSTSQSRVTLLLLMLLLPLLHFQCCVRQLCHLHQASLRSSSQLRVAMPYP